MIERKIDAEQIKAHIEKLNSEPWGPARKMWPNFVFFFACLPNALEILKQGKLISRSHATMVTDTGSEAILSHTSDEWKNCVRLYFRPRTPTQYQVEGFRPKGHWGSLGKHMAVPIFFLFDAKEILTRKTTRFSKGSLSQKNQVGDDAAFFESIPFQKVYHDSWLPEEQKSEIKFHRHAEIIIPNELDLTGLRWIWCRSEAEYQTLLHLLPISAVKTYKDKIRQDKRANLHFCKWTYVESVSLEQNKISFTFNRSSLTPGPFEAHLQITDNRTGHQYFWKNPSYTTTEPLVINIPQFEKPTAYNIRFTLDGEIAFENKFVPKTALF